MRATQGSLLTTAAFPEAYRTLRGSCALRAPLGPATPLVFAFLGAGAAASFFGLHNLKVKETDRIKAVHEALGQLTGETFTGDTQLALMEFPKLRASEPFAVHGDHRMAMALAPLALVCGSIGIRDPEVVRKSYPTFWADLQRVGFRLEQ